MFSRALQFLHCIAERSPFLQAACAVLGFWIGIAGNVPIEAGTNASASYDSDASSDSGADDQLGAFYDLASLEG